MAVRYVRVNPVVDLFSPVIRPTGNVAILGAATSGTDNTPVQVVSPSAAATAFGVPAGSALTRALQLAFQQSPGPAQVWGVKTGTDPAAALTAVEELNVQFVVLANTTLVTATAAAEGAITKLAAHVAAVSNSGGEGRERMAVVMLPKGSTDRALITGGLASERVVYIAHKSDQDAAAAVAGTIAGYPPHVSMLLKQVAISSAPFTSAEVDALNGSETFSSGPAGQGVNWLTTPALIPGGGVYLGEGYTGNPAGKKYIDVVRTVDDISFRLKARLIRSVGSLRISRSGLRSLVVQLEAVLDPLVADGVIESHEIIVPILDLLDADPATLTPAQLQAVSDAQTNRVVEVLAAVDYAGAVHRIAITLKFE
ncbi:hypothetical protein WEI85_35700 [Actinomycetes bacterium KLBMP 9797]